MDLLKEALEPRWVTVQITPAASVGAVSLEDTAGVGRAGGGPAGKPQRLRVRRHVDELLDDLAEGIRALFSAGSVPD